MARIVVTGGAGFIGSHVVDELISAGHSVCVVDDLSSGTLENLKQHKSLDVHRIDILDSRSLAMAMMGAHAVVHLAAKTSVAESVANPELYLRVNILGIASVLETAKKCGVRRVVFASSAAVYGNPVRVPTREEDAVAPMLSPYAVSKRAGEELCQYYSTQGVQTVSLRFFNVYGPRQDPRSEYAGVISAFIDRARRLQPLIINGDGEQTRDFVYVKDVARVIHLALESATDGEVFNIGSGVATRISDLAVALIKASGAKCLIQHGPYRPGDIMHSVADITKARRLLRYEPTTSLAEGLKDTMTKA
ncbi:NAD-dependent epimerase/dehydratase family protein [Candidatus Woesearchaeota archaeon]|nr:NAD-dependent epimerase/dehydratase family protein [Candidatus Woesearchaeota archaeon]